MKKERHRVVHHRVRDRHRKRCDGDSARGRLFGFQALEKITARLDEFEPSRMGVKFGTQVVVFADKKRRLLEGFEPFSLVGLHDEVDSVPVQGGIDSFRNLGRLRPASQGSQAVKYTCHNTDFGYGKSLLKRPAGRGPFEIIRGSRISNLKPPGAFRGAGWYNY